MRSFRIFHCIQCDMENASSFPNSKFGEKRSNFHISLYTVKYCKSKQLRFSKFLNKKKSYEYGSCFLYSQIWKFWIDSKSFFNFFFENFYFLAIFVKKWLSSKKKFQREFFSKSTFSVKNTFWNIQNRLQKKIFEIFLRFFTFWLFSSKNG